MNKTSDGFFKGILLIKILILNTAKQLTPFLPAPKQTVVKIIKHKTLILNYKVLMYSTNSKALTLCKCG